jgi:hypothetical protein
VIADGFVYVCDADNVEFAFAKIKCAKWAKAVNQPLPTTQDQMRHFALDIAAAAVAGHGGREHTTDPDRRIVTFEESDGSVGNPTTLTIERGSGFAILRDKQEGDVYSAQIIMIAPDELKRGRWFNPAPPSDGEAVIARLNFAGRPQNASERAGRGQCATPNDSAS